MKILQVISTLEFGGAEKLVTDLTCILKTKGYKVDLAVFSHEETPLKKKLEQIGVHVYELGNRPYQLTNCFKLIRIAKQYDIVHTHNYAPQLFGAFSSLFTSCKWITTEHSPSNRRRNIKLFAYIDSWMYHRYHQIIVISDQALNNLLHFVGSIRIPTTIIPNGIDVNSFYHAIPNKNLRTNDKFIIINVAGFRYEKDQDTLIKGMTYLPSDKFELWLVGDGDRRKELEALVVSLGVQNTVKFLGKRSDVPSLLKAADAVVMCSHYEGLSLSNIEGMSVGKPFVADDVVGLKEMTKDAGLLFPYKNAKAFAEIMLSLQKDPTKCQQIAQLCYQKAQQFDIHQTVEAYECIYNKF